jgi:hypothetical protein
MKRLHAVASARSCQPPTHLRDHRQVFLALVALESLLERGGGLFRPPGTVQNLGKVAERVALSVEHVRLLEEATASRQSDSASGCSAR